MGSNRIESFDVSPKERELIDWRSARRTRLRQEYLRQVHHPTKQEIVTENSVQRFAVMRLTHEYQAKLTGRSFVLGVGGTLGGIALITWLMTSGKKSQEHRLRTGQVSYANREFKFN